MTKEYPTRSSHFASFHAEGTINFQPMSRVMMGRNENNTIPGTLGSICISIDQSRYHNGNELFVSSAAETGLFVINSIEHVQRKLIKPGKIHPNIAHINALQALGTFVHIDPSGYTSKDLSYGLDYNFEDNSVDFGTAELIIPEYSHNQQLFAASIEKLISTPRG